MHKVAAVLACSVLSAGCVLSTDAVISEADAIFDSRLLGTWQQVSNPDGAVVRRSGPKGYAIEYTDRGGKAVRLEGRLGRLGKRLVLDVWPTPSETELSEPYRDWLIAGHLLLALDIGNGEVRAAPLEPDSLKTRLRSGEVRLAYILDHDRPILNGTTSQVRAVLGPYLERPGALADGDVWRRVAGAAADVAASSASGEDPCFEASPWRNADLLFRRDPHWVGSDGAYSIDLGNDRTLWLFGDTFIDASGRHTRVGSRMVRNTVAIQTGRDPSRAKIVFYWGKTTDGRSGSFFPDEGSYWFWPGHGIRIGDRLILFFGRLRGTRTGLGFAAAGWRAIMVDNPDDEPPRWRAKTLRTRDNPLGVGPGAGVIQLGEHVYAFGAQEPVNPHPIHVVRWRVDDVRKGNLLDHEWWAGPDIGWVADSSTAARWPVFENGQSEFSIHYDTITRRFLELQTNGFGAADVVIRSAPALTGPWTPQRLLYRPSEYYQPDIMIYAAKAHPQLSGADLVLTYATNSFRFEQSVGDSLIYYPRFLRLTRCTPRDKATNPQPN
jgi:hypothetical protein